MFLCVSDITSTAFGHQAYAKRLLWYGIDERLSLLWTGICDEFVIEKIISSHWNMKFTPLKSQHCFLKWSLFSSQSTNSAGLLTSLIRIIYIYGWHRSLLEESKLLNPNRAHESKLLKICSHSVNSQKGKDIPCDKSLATSHFPFAACYRQMVHSHWTPRTLRYTSKSLIVKVLTCQAELNLPIKIITSKVTNTHSSHI